MRSDDLRTAKQPNELLRAAREATGLSRAELGAHVRAWLATPDGMEPAIEETHIAKLERGEHRWPRADYREALRAVLGAESDAELGFWNSRRRPHSKAVGAVNRQDFLPGGRTTIALPRDVVNDLEQVSELLRRTFLKHGIAAVTALPARNLDRRVIQALDVINSDDLGGLAQSLSELTDHYALTICSLPPAKVYDELLAVRSYASGVLDRAGSTQARADLALATGWLSNLLAIAACDMGEHATARVWCSDAERLSHKVGHPEQAAWAVLTRAMVAFYQGQPRQSVKLAARGQSMAPMGTVIHAKLASQEMRATAMVGDEVRMASAHNYAAKAIAALPLNAASTGAFSIALAEDPPYTATSLLLVGRYKEAVSATNRVIDTVYQPEARQRGEHPSGYARSLLILGLAQAGVGCLDESVAAGRAALNGSRPAWPIMVLADKLDKVLAHDYPDDRQAAEYHAHYVEASSRPAGHEPPLLGPATDVDD